MNDKERRVILEIQKALDIPKPLMGVSTQTATVKGYIDFAVEICPVIDEIKNVLFELRTGDTEGLLDYYVEQMQKAVKNAEARRND